MSVKSGLGLKKTFSWKFGPSKFTKRIRCSTETDSDENSSRPGNTSFPFHQGNEPEREDLGPDGLIPNILDGVVFTPVGSEFPQPSPDFRRLSNLSSFRGEDNTNTPHPDKSANHNNDTEANKVVEPIKNKAFQEELFRAVHQNASITRQLSCRANSALPPLPTENQKSQSGDTNLLPEFDNPLYQTLSECQSGLAPKTKTTKTAPEVTYAAIDEADPHYQTVVSGVPVTHHSVQSETVYARVDDESDDDVLTHSYEKKQKHLTKNEIQERFYENLDDSQSQDDAIYANVEELQTYANIPNPDPALAKANVLSALILDVNGDTPTKTSKTTPSGSSSGHSSLPSPDLSPADSLLNVSAASSRAVSRSPDSGVFVGLLQPVQSKPIPKTPKPLIIPVTKPLLTGKENVKEQLSKTLLQFEQLEQESSCLTPSDPKHQISDQGSELLQSTRKLLRKNPKSHKKMDVEKSLFSQADDLVTDAEFLAVMEENAQNTLGLDENFDDEVDITSIPPEMPTSPPPPRIPPPTVIDSEDEIANGIFVASYIPIDSEPPSILTDQNDSLITDLKQTEVNNNVFDDSEEISTANLLTPIQSNIGKKIAEDQMKKQQMKDTLRSEKVGILNIGESFQDIERERHNIIEKQVVKAKRLDSWIPDPSSGESPLKQRNELKSTSIDVISPKGWKPPTPSNVESPKLPPPSVGASPKLPPPSVGANQDLSSPSDETRDVDSASILANKEKTKQYWQNKMLNYEAKKEHKEEAPLSPPPGFECGFQDNSLEKDIHLQSLNSEDFVEVGSVTVEGDLPTNLMSVESNKKQFVYGLQQDFHDLDENIDKPQSKTVSTSMKKTKNSFPQTYFDVANQEDTPDSDSLKENPQETVIEKEIRLQKEREEALAREREIALQMLEAQKKISVNRSPTVKDVDTKEEIIIHKSDITDSNKSVAPVPIKKTMKPKPVHSVSNTTSSAESRISEEIRELQRREEELRRLREMSRNEHGSHDDNGENMISMTTTDEGLYSDPDVHSETNSSRVASPETMPEYSKFLHNRTQSLESMSSGHSSGDHAASGHLLDSAVTSVSQTGNVGKRRVVVKPLDEPEDNEETPAYRRVLKETPIEREIRLAREREEALRREKGHPSWVSNFNKQNEKENKTGNGRNAASNDTRGVQHRLATSRIQQEIEETSEREIELREAGTIQTTSEERVDSKVARLSQLAEYSAGNYATRKLNKSVSTPHLDLSGIDSTEKSSPTPEPAKMVEEPPQKPRLITRALSTNTGTTVPQNSVRRFANTGGPQRGLMEKFLATRGRLNSQPAFSVVNQNNLTPGSLSGDSAGVMNGGVPVKAARSVQPISPVSLELANYVKEENLDGDKDVAKVPPPRRHFATTEEKIQEELREMKQREEELRLNRMKMFAKSQPNLLACLDQEDTQEDQDLMAHVNGSSDKIRSAVSSSNLLADEQQPSINETSQPSAAIKKNRRKSALIEQWENRIQQKD